MSDRAHLDDRVAIVMLTQRDSERSARLLAEVGIPTVICSDLTALCRELRSGVGSVLMADEVLSGDRTGLLAEALRTQPSWSAIPLLLLAREGAAHDARRTVQNLGTHVTLVERPVRTRTLVSVVEAALRARRHQYQIRDALVESERQATELRGQDERLRFALAAAKLGSWELELVSSRLSGSEQFNAIHGRAAGEPFSYEDLISSISHADAHLVMAAIEHSIRTGEDYDIQYRIRWPAGEERWVMARGRVAYDGTGKPLRMVGVALDVTERKRMDEALDASRTELARQADQLRDADRAKDEFLATLAHELRNPLAPIQTGLDLLQMYPGKEVMEKTIATMSRQLGHMVRLVDDLLDVSRITRGKLELKREPVTLAAVVDVALEASRTYFERGGQKLQVALPEATLWFDVDVTRVAQVINNLLNNASKYTPRGGLVALTARRELGNVVIEVRDDGIGIPADRLDDVFEMFRQVHRTLQQSKGGLGIGLALVKRLVEMHGGSVRAKSAGPGLGSNFEITLPLIEHVTSAESRTDSLPQSGRRILIVDDNEDAAEMLSLVLEGEGHQTHTAGDGPAAIAAVGSFHPQVVFLDIGLPGMNGYEVARELRKDWPAARLTLIALTGWGSADDKQLSREAGIDFHLTKPVDIHAVHRVLANVAVPGAASQGRTV
jgi:PAS domain S-box-containing protein